MDLHAAIDSTWTLHPGERCIVPIGIAVAIQKGLEGQIRPRSGLAAKHRVTVANAPGTIDADYRGEVKVILINHGPSEFDIRPGDRVAQLVTAPVVQEPIHEVDDLEDTARGAGGFGSTGR
jgi:dUTP pyrophosphatase